MKIFDYFDFIFESSDTTFPFFYSSSMSEKLSRIDSPISDGILDMKWSEQKVSMINIGSKEDTITFVQAKKLADFFSSYDKEKWNKILRNVRPGDEIWVNNMSEMKIGRFVKRLFENEFSDAQIEEFVNKWKSLNNLGEFQLWDRNLIKDAYDSTKYSQDGPSSNTLMNSCMNDSFELVDYYRHSSANILVLLDDEGHIMGRALVWTDTRGRKIMDRVYYIWDSDYHKFISYARSKKWYYKSRNISGGSSFVGPDGKEGPLRTMVKVPNCWDIKDYNEFPYMDTFYYTTGEVAMNYQPTSGEYLQLQDTTGGYEYYSNEYDIHGNGIDDMSEYVMSETQGGFIRHDGSVHLKYDGGGYSGLSFDDYIEKDYLENPRNGFVKASDDKWYKETHCVWSDRENAWIFRPNAIYDKTDWISWDNFNPGGK